MELASDLGTSEHRRHERNVEVKSECIVRVASEDTALVVVLHDDIAYVTLIECVTVYDLPNLVSCVIIVKAVEHIRAVVGRELACDDIVSFVCRDVCEISILAVCLNGHILNPPSLLLRSAWIGHLPSEHRSCNIHLERSCDFRDRSEAVHSSEALFLHQS